MSYSFHPCVERWFSTRFGGPTEPQAEGWPSIQAGNHTLIAAPTGSGKTLAAFLASLDRLVRLGEQKRLEDETYVVYVSPLRALSNDINKNLAEPLAGIAQVMEASGHEPIGIRTAVRSGDTSQAERRAMLKCPPHILVTTPESLYLLLTATSGRNLLRMVDTLIVDEIHAMADDRRGTHLTLTMERLDRLVGRPVQRIGLSATQKPMERIASFLTGIKAPLVDGAPACTIVDQGHLRELDLALELPRSPLQAVMSNEVWEELYARICDLVEAHQTTLIFVNTRRLAERMTFHLVQKMGEDAVASHHGSLSERIRHQAESRLKRGTLKVIVATASLELGIDIGTVDLVCQMGSPRAIATLLQRVGRSGHYRGGKPKGRIFPLTRDELIEAAALVDAAHAGELDCIRIPECPIDVLAQQMVAATACEPFGVSDLFALCRGAYPYRNLERETFMHIVHMLAEGFSTKRGRRGAHLFYDAVNERVRPRKGARLAAITSGGAIPDQADYRVLLEPAGTFIGTLNEDFAFESLPGDIFQLGNNSWKIRKIETGVVRVEDAHGQPPTIPFWLGEAPGRSDELSLAVASLHGQAESNLEDAADFYSWMAQRYHMPEAGSRLLYDYLAASYKMLGCLPSQDTVVLERFFDEAGGQQLVIHACFGSRINRAWGLALRKRFCRSFNFELQAAATENAIVLSLGPKHSFPLEEVFGYLRSASVRTLLVQALLDAPMFQTRWRWNANRALALLRFRGGKRVPPQFQRMEAEDLIAVVFPDQLACLENIAGDREVPDHPLVNQTIEDCLHEVMDIKGLEAVLARIEQGEIRCVAVDLPEPSPLSHEILNAKPYAFLDDAPAEERRTQAVHLRRTLSPQDVGELGVLDEQAIQLVRGLAWPRPRNADEVHEALFQLGGLPHDALDNQPDPAIWQAGLNQLFEEGRATRLFGQVDTPIFVATERVPLWMLVWPEAILQPQVNPPQVGAYRANNRHEALLELARGHMEVCGPITEAMLSNALALGLGDVTQALLALEAEGMVMRGHFSKAAAGQLEWCNRRLLARIHQRTIKRLRAEIKPVTLSEYVRFLCFWQRLHPETKVRGVDGLDAVIGQLEGFEAAAQAWEQDILPSRMEDYESYLLDQLCLAGKVSWGRIRPPAAAANTAGRASGPMKSTPISFFYREHAPFWLCGNQDERVAGLSGYAAQVYEVLQQMGAVFFDQISAASRLLPSQVEMGLGGLVAGGLAVSDSFAGLRALIRPANQKRKQVPRLGFRSPHSGGVIALAGRWSLTRIPVWLGDQEAEAYWDQVRHQARVFLRRYGVVFRRLFDREPGAPPWRDLLRVYRYWEAVGEIRGGHFVQGLSGEHFALPEALGSLRSVRRKEKDHLLLMVQASDPLNVSGWLFPGDVLPRESGNYLFLADGELVAMSQKGQLQPGPAIEHFSAPQVEDLLRKAKRRFNRSRENN